jgi:hypothetical protein
MVLTFFIKFQKYMETSSLNRTVWVPSSEKKLPALGVQKRNASFVETGVTSKPFPKESYSGSIVYEKECAMFLYRFVISSYIISLLICYQYYRSNLVPFPSSISPLSSSSSTFDGVGLLTFPLSE